MEQEIKWYQQKRFLIPSIVAAPFVLSALVSDGSVDVVKTEEVNIPQKTIEIETKKPVKQNTALETKFIEREPVVVPQVKQVETKQCHPSYSGCLNPSASDYDCAGGSGNGPYYTGPVQVLGSDVFDLDRDNDGLGCE